MIPRAHFHIASRRDLAPAPTSSDETQAPLGLRPLARGWLARALHGAAALALALAALACGSTGVSWSAGWENSWGRFDAQQRGLLRQARHEIDTGRPELGWALLAPSALADARNIELALILQDIELELARRDLPAPEGAPAELRAALDSSEPLRALSALYAARAAAEPELVTLLLAARLQSEPMDARRYLDQAALLEPGCAWVDYAAAHVALRDAENKDRWRVAQDSLKRALELDPDHLRARRLQAWMMTQEGSGSSGLAALERWLVEVEGDPRVANEERQRAQLDLVREHLVQGNLQLAREILLALEGGTVDRARRYLLLACAEHALGEPEAALDAARRAEAARRNEALPLVQQALLLEELELDSDDSEQAWQRVVERATASADLAGLLQVLRARVLLERRSLGRGPGAGADEADEGASVARGGGQ